MFLFDHLVTEVKQCWVQWIVSGDHLGTPGTISKNQVENHFGMGLTTSSYKKPCYGNHSSNVLLRVFLRAAIPYSSVESTGPKEKKVSWGYIHNYSFSIILYLLDLVKNMTRIYITKSFTVKLTMQYNHLCYRRTNHWSLKSFFWNKI